MEEKLTKITKPMRAGYQGRKDSMREKADKLMGKKGNCEKELPKFAMGGVAKIRHEEATPQGLPRTFKKKSLNGVL